MDTSNWKAEIGRRARTIGRRARGAGGEARRALRRLPPRTARILGWTAGLLIFLVLAIALIDVLADEPIRASVERRMNAALDGYTVRLGGADFKPWNFGLDLEELVVYQDAHPDPPVLDLAAFEFSIHWRALLLFRLVADADLVEPRLFVHLPQLREEREDDVDVEDRGWVEAVEEAYPLKINELRIANGSVTYVDDDPERPLQLSEIEGVARNLRNVQSPDTRYPSAFRGSAAVFGTELTLSGWSNRPDAAPSRFQARGAFMGSGRTAVQGVFRQDLDGADFDLAIAIEGTKLAAMNDLLRAHADLDVTEGSFSFYSEVRVAGGQIDGYVKPLFHEVEIYDPEQDREKSFFQRLWERIAEGLAEILENRPREDVVTVADISGPVSNPDASNLQVVLNLIRNAFFDAIVPGFRAQADSAD